MRDANGKDRICKWVSFDADTSGYLVLPVETTDPITRDYLNGGSQNDYIIKIMKDLTRPKDVILDAGCHVGTFSIGAALLERKIVAIDANRLHVDLVSKSAAINKIADFSIVHRAVSMNSKPLKFVEEGLFGRIDFDGIHASSVEVKTITLDEVAARYAKGERVRFLKIDIEGAEYEAFQSAERLLRDDGPVIWWESNGPTLKPAGRSIRDVRALLESYGYKTFRVEGERWIYAPVDQIQPEAWLDVLSISERDQKRWAHLIDWDWPEDKLVERCQTWTGFHHRHTLEHLLDEIARYPHKAAVAEVEGEALKQLALL